MVQPKRRICQVPAGTSQRRMPSLESLDVRSTTSALRVLLPGFGWQLLEQRRGVRCREVQRLVQRLLFPVLDGLASREGRKRRGGVDPIRYHCNVTPEPIARLGQRQRLIELRRAVRQRFRPRQLLGRVLGFDHRPAQIPAALDVQAHLQPQTVGLTQRVLVKLPPLGRKEGGAVRNAVVAVLLRPAGIADQRSSKALGLHPLQVAGNRGLGHIAVQPPPIGAQPCAVGRISKPLRQLIGLRRTSTAKWKPGLGQQAKQHRTGDQPAPAVEHTTEFSLH